jgi:hypothetical protein
MSLQMLKQVFKSGIPSVLCISLTVLAAWEPPTIIAQESALRQQQVSSAGHHLVVLLDINPHQKKVLNVEQALAEGVIQKLAQPGNTFSVITFGSQTPRLLKASVVADEAIAVIRDITIEQTKEKYFSVLFYDALRLAIGQFTDDAGSKSLLVISDANHYFPRKTFKETVVRARQLQAACDMAIVADHSFYGGRVQRYGYELWGLARKTHGQYVEVGGKQKKIPRSVERLSEGILSRGQDQR